MVARLTRLLGPAYVALAEETVQDAMLRALQVWPYQGVPDNPAGWLFRVAHNLAIDAVRRDNLFGAKTDAIVEELTRSSQRSTPALDVDAELRDDELRMIFMCCHPAIAREARVALSLKIIGGFSVDEIARAFLADPPAIAQRLVRAKRQIRDRQLTLEMPLAPDLLERLDSVLDVLYFLFNEGYAARAGSDLIRRDLCAEALRLASLVAAASIATPTVHALVALMALQAARLAARTDAAGDLVLLENQDRSRWDDRLIAIGFWHFDLSMDGSEVSEYHVQAPIAATHARGMDPYSVDWPLIVRLYDQLLALNPSPVVALNRAVAVSKVSGPTDALDAIAPLESDPKLQHYHLLMAVRGQLLLDLGRAAEAADALRAALACVCTEPERRFLREKLDRLLTSSPSSSQPLPSL